MIITSRHNHSKLAGKLTRLCTLSLLGNFDSEIPSFILKERASEQDGRHGLCCGLQITKQAQTRQVGGIRFVSPVPLSLEFILDPRGSVYSQGFSSFIEPARVGGPVMKKNASF